MLERERAMYLCWQVDLRLEKKIWKLPLLRSVYCAYKGECVSQEKVTAVCAQQIPDLFSLRLFFFYVLLLLLPSPILFQFDFRRDRDDAWPPFRLPFSSRIPIARARGRRSYWGRRRKRKSPHLSCVCVCVVFAACLYFLFPSKVYIYFLKI